MQGLLGNSMDDPRTMAVLQGVMGLLGARGNVQGVAQGLLGYQGAMQQAKQQAAQEEERATRRQMAEMQLRQAQQEQARRVAVEQAYRGALRSPEQMAMAAHGGPTNAAAQAAPGMAPGFDQNALIRGLTQADPMTAAQLLQPKPADYKVVGDALLQVGPGGVKEAYRAPAKPEAMPSAVREYEYARQQGYQGTFQQFQIEQRRAGATNVSVNNAEKPLVNTIATGLGKQLDDGLSAARAASTAIVNAQNLRKAAESGNIIAGPTASVRIPLLQIGQMIGVGGKNDAERLSNTRQAVQTMAQAELDAAQQMKGQGQITEAERDIIRRAAAGDISSFTAPEISQLSQAIEKTARAKIASHRRSVGSLQNIKGAESLLPFYQVEEPGAYVAPGGEWSIRPVGGN